MPKLIDEKIFPFHIKDHPQLQSYMNITIISSIIIVASATYLLGYFFSIGSFDRLLSSTLSLSKSFQYRFEDLNKYDNFSGFYYVAGLINYFLWSIFLFFSSIVAYSKRKTANISGGHNNVMIIGTGIFYFIALFSTYILLFHHVGISEEKYVRTSRFFTVYFFPFFLGMSIFWVQACAFSTAALFHRLNKG
ncbi:hypothetical protein [Neorhizobium galegae]|uniref:hypothetical protein n=1 Tax=Neorhizobium galegae TaxID=399 RepID=UPI00127AA21E|nr:hypothetical protein [Neorhizobium galegae]KAA9387102.1 hypothetical protein F4V88_11805 [Neorhizobium galegae]KAB1116215.1 hypothetical protein F4V89_02675 [Neorhizobium galegae]MCM2501694.1 hypothetical protein [Neorhizobium galegae]MCQ1771440.1 hypothetical protein [Neorhizobium galegae]MCQ1778458.1 hypothetical protein [Neorhizobium galegae]